jgi:hypothetical protein
MYQTINEDIAVVGVYSKSCFIPKKFKWKDRVFPIQEITLFSDVRSGDIRKRLYSVTSGGNVYRLEFNRSSEKWQILEIWIE